MSTTQAGSLQLSSRGSQDSYLSHPCGFNPFREIDRRSVPFTEISTALDFKESGVYGRTITCEVPPAGDLLRRLTFYLQLPALQTAPGSTYTGWVNAVGHAIIESAELIIGGKVVEKQPGIFMEACSPIDTEAGKREVLSAMVGRYDTHRVLGLNALESKELYVPLQFGFTKDLGTALPLFLLYRHDVQVRLHTRRFAEIVTYDGPLQPVEAPVLNARIIAEYVLLDPCIREPMRRQPCYEMVFEQWQAVTESSVRAGTMSARIDLPFSNCVKDLWWLLVERESFENNDYFFFGKRDPANLGAELCRSASLSFDTSARFEKMPESFYRWLTTTNHSGQAQQRNVYYISFAERADSTRITGYANFSRFDHVVLNMEFPSDVPECYFFLMVRAYNVLSIADGMATLQFSH
jgi:hypothetical protein